MMTRRAVVPATLTAAAVAAWIIAITSIDVRAIGPLGFVTVAGTAYWVAWALLVLAMCINLFSERTWHALLPVQTVAVIAILHATVPIVEAVPRFATGWLHAGFAEHIMRTGQTLPLLDARFEWPGFFSAAAMLTRAGGFDSPVALMRWTPVVLNLAYAVLVYAITTLASGDRRLRWVAVWVFLVGNWVGQDYFSPQGTAVLLFLAIVLIVLVAFHGRPAPMSLLSGTVPLELRVPPWIGPLLSGRPPARRERGHGSGTHLRPAVRTMLILLMVLMFGALVVTHQLTPVALITCIMGLVVAGRCRLSLLPLLMGIMFFGWVSFGAETYWAGHLSNIFGGVGAVGSSVTQNIGSRIGGSDARLTVLAVRLGFTAVICGLALVGFLRRGTRPMGRSFVVLGTAPFLVLAGNAYGGEALMRAYFYALPFIALYTAAALVAPVPLPVRRRDGTVAQAAPRPWPAAVAPAIVATLLLAAVVPFTVARYGNESFEMATPEERDLFDAFYANAPGDADLVTISTEVPARYREVASHHLVSLDRSDEFLAADVDHLEGAARAHGLSAVLVDAAISQLDADPASQVVVSRGQDAFGQLTWSLPARWTATFVRDLLATGRFTVVFENRDGWVLRSTDAPAPVAAAAAPAEDAAAAASAEGAQTTLPAAIRATATTLFALTVPGATLIAVLLLCGVGVRRRRSANVRLPGVVLGALVVPLSVSVLIATAQAMLWLRTWRPTEAMVLLAAVSVPVLLAVVAWWTSPGGADGWPAMPTPDPVGERRPMRRVPANAAGKAGS